MNKVILMGRLTKNVEVRITQSGKAFARFTVATDRPGAKEGQQSADFPSCTAWGKTAEFISRYFQKGSRILIEGTLNTGSYQDKNGNKVYTTEVGVFRAEFCESKSSGQGYNQGGYNSGMENMGQQTPFDEEVPF